MERFDTLISNLLPLPQRDVDTDQIIPARYLKVTDKSGLAEGLFARWRYLEDGSPDAGFPLEQSVYRGARVLLVGDNFGCGSSREHAVWALLDWGFRAVVSTSFADIFRNNALKNGLLPVEVDGDTLDALFRQVAEDPGVQVTIDLHAQSLRLLDGTTVGFPIDPFSKLCMLEGIDPLGYLLRHIAQIEAYEQAHWQA